MNTSISPKTYETTYCLNVFFTKLMFATALRELVKASVLQKSDLQGNYFQNTFLRAKMFAHNSVGGGFVRDFPCNSVLGNLVFAQNNL
jgi:hypothetical protein